MPKLALKLDVILWTGFSPLKPTQLLPLVGWIRWRNTSAMKP
jgi:hypothetical protein